MGYTLKSDYGRIEMRNTENSKKVKKSKLKSDYGRIEILNEKC